MRILLVEDDRSLADIVASGLEEKDIRVTVAHNFADGKMEAVLNTFDVIVLDVMLPGGSGFELCKYLRDREIGDLYYVPDWRGLAPGQRPQTRNQLAKSERLCEVVVCTRLETRNAVVNCIARREH